MVATRARGGQVAGLAPVPDGSPREDGGLPEGLAIPLPPGQAARTRIIDR